MNRITIYILLCTVIIGGFTSCESEPTAMQSTKKSKMKFTSLDPSDTGVDFVNKVAESAFRNSMFFDYFLNGSGVAVGDINNDGLADIFFAGNDAENRLYLNKSDFKFEDITSSAIPQSGAWSTGVNMVDVNGDGYLDIFVCHSGMVEKPEELANQLLINNGDLTFKDATEEYGLVDLQLSVHTSFFDYDKDGDLDLWLSNHINFDDNLKKLFEDGERPHDERKQFRSCLYENQDGRFVDVTESTGVSRESASLGVVTSDFNGDGWLDIYVSNDYDVPDYYFLNNGDKTFTEVSKSKVGHTSFYSMGIDAADLNNDQVLDMVAVDMTPQDHVRNKVLMASMDSKKFQYLYDVLGMTRSYMFNTVQMGVGDGSFSEVGNYMGVAQTEWSWAPLIADYDNDGYKDLYVTNGYLRDTKDNDFKRKVDEFKAENGGQWNQEIYEKFTEWINSTPVLNKIFRNKDGKLKDVTMEWSDLPPTFSNGAAYADLDNDGDLDLVINNLDQPASILRNDVTQTNYVQIMLKGANKEEIVNNAEVYLHTGKGIQRADYNFSRGFQSSVQHRVHFGLGEQNNIEKVIVKWTDGKEESFQSLEANTLHTLQRGKGSAYSDRSDEKIGLFKEVTSEILDSAMNHHEYKFDDFAKEILLPHKYSDLGPALAVADINGDGQEDLFLGGSNTSESRILMSDNNSFTVSHDPIIENDKRYEDLGAAFFDFDGDGHLDLYVASGGGGEIEDYPDLTQDRLYKNNGQGGFVNKTDLLPPIHSSTKAIVAFDADNDGDLDLIVGGRNTPGKYPMDARSYFLENSGGYFRDRSKKRLKDFPGMVTDIELADINDDGWMDLVVVGEWSSPVIFLNHDGEFRKEAITALSNNNGWWQSIQKADLDNDGDIDFVLGNMGENSKFHPNEEKPLGILASDFDDSGSLDIVLTKKYKDMTVPVRGKECSSEQMPMLKEKFGTYEGFATSSIEDILGEEKIEEAFSRSASDFSSYILINEGQSDFSIQKLPNEAQWFPVMDIQVADFNADGKLDIFLVGNKINAEPETPSYDAGRGLVLLGDGKLNFSPINSIEESGIDARNDARAVRWISTQNGQKLLVIANNNGPLQFYALK